jgi:DNA-binding transcriptional regulator/RsmH inhibitor MraZ
MPKRRDEDHGGYSEHRIDEAGRITLTNVELAALGETIYIINWIEKCVRLCSGEGLAEVKQFLVNGLPNQATREWAAKITMIDVPRTVTPDQNGRIRVPETCLKHAKIERGMSSVVVMPVGKGIFEVWDRALYDQISEEKAADIQRMMWGAPAEPPPAGQ